MMNDILFVIPARGGSKGIPGKNIKLLGRKPLLHYSMEYARTFVNDDQICLSTDDPEIAHCASLSGYEAPFLRPSSLATDHAGTYEVLQHALNYYIDKGYKYKAVVLLQPTSPFREKRHLLEALTKYNNDVDMVVSVIESPYNPYYNLFEKDAGGNLKISKGGGAYTRRQDVPPVYAYNGSLYIINSESLLKRKSFAEFSRIVPYEVASKYSIDLDTIEDWEKAEYFLSKSKHEKR